MINVRPLVPAEETTPISPSEALRLGRLTRPRQIIMDLFNGQDGACALGAIATGYGIPTDAFNIYDQLLAHGMDRDAACPAGCDQLWNRSLVPLGSTVRDEAAALDITYHLNDYHEWTDDQIVGWLEGLGL